MDVESRQSAAAPCPAAMLHRVSSGGRSSHLHHAKPLEMTSNSNKTSRSSSSSSSSSFSSSCSEICDRNQIFDIDINLEEQTDQKVLETKEESHSRRDSGIDCSYALKSELDLDLSTKSFTRIINDTKIKGQVKMNPSNSHLSQDHGSQVRFIDGANKPFYGIRSKEIIATNNPTCLRGEGPFLPEHDSTFSIPKYISAHADTMFTKLWEQGLGDDVTSIILANLPDAERWVLAVFRLGFAQDRLNNPIVITITISENDSPKPSAIQELISSIAALPVLQSYKERVYVDVCRSVCTATSTTGDGYCNMNSDLYSLKAPCIGYSIGPKDMPSRAGSFTCFIKHETTTYGLTNEHVLNGTKHPYLLPTSPYTLDQSNPTAPKFTVAMPAIQDHNNSLQCIEENIEENTEDEPEGDFADETLLHTSKHGIPKEDRGMDPMRPFRALAKQHWEGVRERRAVWNPEVGHIIATSGQEVTHSFSEWLPYRGRLDWAIFTCSTPNQVSEFRKISAYDEGSFSRRNFDEKIKEEFRDFISTATKKFRNPCPIGQPRDEPPQEDETLFKVASRTTGFREAICTGIKATFYNKANTNRRITHEYCFISRNILANCSEKGDSGAIIFDQQFQPVAMMWGGTAEKYPDTTYATPLVDIFRHIEHTMGWVKGSVSIA